MRSLQLAIVVSCLAHPVFCCRARTLRGEETDSRAVVVEQSKDSETTAPDPLKQKMGINAADVSPYDGSKYGRKNGPVSSGSELACDFEKPCCWNNDKPPLDELEFLVSNVRPSQQIFVEYFDGTVPPASTYMLTAASDTDPSVGARFRSCTIACSESVSVTLSHWTTPLVQLQVCRTLVDDALHLLVDCEVLPRNQSPGPTTVKLPAGRDYDIVIVASNFLESDGGVAVIDDIQVSFAPCAPPTTTQRPTTTRRPPPPPPTTTTPLPPVNRQTCNRVVCQEPPCQYSDGLDAIDSPLFAHVDQRFKVVSGQFNNKITGVKNGRTSSADKYLAVYLHPGEAAGLDSGLISINEPLILRYDVYEAVYDMELKVCFDEISRSSCPIGTNQKASRNDRNWSTQNALVPQGTRRIMFLGENQGRNQGALGLDNIRLLTRNFLDPADLEGAFEDACFF